VESLLPLEVGGRSLASTFFAPPAGRPRPGLLFLHGMNSEQTGYRERALAVVDTLGVACLTVDLGGHGKSTGELAEMTPRDHADDVTAAYDALAGRPEVDPTRIGVCGASYGGYLAAVLTGRRDVRQLLLRAPALYDDDLFDQPLSVPRRSAGGVAPTIATRNLSTSDRDVLLVESGADEVIPPAVITAYLRACPQARHVILPGVGHTLTEPAWRRLFLDEILTFFAALPRADKSRPGKTPTG
jgi:pimeloyl-ACP methyl ester carboxylesterase